MKIKYVGKCLLLEEEGEGVLVVGDLHLGYEESLNVSGVSFSEKMFNEMIVYFDSVFEKIGKVDKIVLLGDVKHDFSGNTKQEWNSVLKLFDYLLLHCKKIIVTKGNHDNYLKAIAGKRSIEVLDCYIWQNVAFVHGNKEYSEMTDKNVEYWVIGHGHPAIKIRDEVKVEKYKCFLEGKFGGRKIIILPSFVEFNEGSDVREYDLGLAWKFDLKKFSVLVVREDLNVLNFGKLKNIR